MTTVGPPPDAAEAVLPAARFLFEPAEIAAGFARLDRKPPNSPLFEGLPAPPRAPQPRLEDAGQLRPVFKAIFSVLADLRGSLAIEVASGSVVTSRRVVWSGPQLPYLVLGQTADGLWDIAFLPNLSQVLAVIDDSLGLTGGGASTFGAFTVDLPPAAFAVIVAFGDLIEEEALQLRLARLPGPGQRVFEPIDAGELARVLAAGLAADDPRWGVTLAARLGVDELSDQASVGALQAGLWQLAGLDCVTEDALITTRGLGLVRLLSQPTLAASLACAVSDGATASEGSLLIYRSGRGILVGAWQPGPAGRVLSLAEMPAAAALKLVAGLITAAPPATDTRVCPNCAAPAAADARFCARCGHALAG